MTKSTGKYRRRGTGSIRNGYLLRTANGESKFEHVIIAEKALGRPLPAGTVVHHLDGNKLNNDPTNLAILPNQAYHRIVHRRMDALAACGHPDWRKCWVCKIYDAPDNLYISPNGMNIHHHHCMRKETTP